MTPVIQNMDAFKRIIWQLILIWIKNKTRHNMKGVGGWVGVECFRVFGLAVQMCHLSCCPNGI